jgi:hypothetical protein
VIAQQWGEQQANDQLRIAREHTWERRAAALDRLLWSR